jgi:hypothetical protein
VNTDIEEFVMSTGIRLALALGLIALPHVALAAGDSAPLCGDVAGSKAVVASQHGRWIELDADQWQFLRGVYAMNPVTPPGLPYGDRAALARFDGLPNGIVFFIDGDRACTPMTAPPALLSLMKDVATHTIQHEGPGL